jgi:trehalose 6-phosphate synthase
VHAPILSYGAGVAGSSTVVVSNRGPLSFRRDGDGQLIARRGAGGLVSGIGPLVAGTGATWIAAALSDGDRAAAAGGTVEADGFRVRLLDLDPDVLRMAYDVVGNATLWFAHHGLWELARRPRFDGHFTEAWSAYRTYNAAFATAVAEAAPEGATVLVQDYHLSLLGPLLAAARPDLRAVHFSHTPFATPEWLAVLPRAAVDELLTGMAGHAACGFHSSRWEADFLACCHRFGVQPPATFVAPLGPDPGDIGGVAASPACDDALASLEEEVGDRQLIVRVDRIELSKNLLRGFWAYDELLEQHPELREQVVFGAFVYPSREGLPEYLAYRQEVETLVARLEARWGTDSWRPVLLDTGDDFPRSVAALRRSDVLLVNPIRDGLNLVAKEGALVNERDGVLALSTEAGAWEELGPHSLEVHPYDVSATAEVLHRALTMPAAARATQAEARLAVVRGRTPADWLADQLAAAG